MENHNLIVPGLCIGGSGLKGAAGRHRSQRFLKHFFFAGHPQFVTCCHRRHPDDRLPIEGVISTAVNLETAFLEAGFKDLFIWVLPIIIILDENCAFQLHNIK